LAIVEKGIINLLILCGVNVMARRKSPTLTDGELRLMQVIWGRGSATVGDVVDALAGRETPAYSTVLTMLRILEQKGYLRHEKEGRAFVYYPVIEKNDARRSAIRHLMSRLFDNSPESLVLNLIENEELSSEDLDRIKKLIEDADTK